MDLIFHDIIFLQGYTLPSLFSSVNLWMKTGGVILGSIGLLRIYQKWNSGKGRNIDEEIYMWMGGALFLVLIGTIVSILF